MAEDRSQASKVAIGTSVTAALIAVAALLKSRREAGAPGEVVIPDEVIQLIMAMAATLDATNTGIQAMLAELRKLTLGLDITVKGWPSNVKGTRTIIVTCANAGQAYRADTLLVPDGMGLLIRAHPLNAVGSLVLVATNSAECLVAGASYPLQPSEIVVYNVKDAHDIYVSANVAGSIVIFSAEQEM